jgi:hypothetical protein
MMRDGHAFDWQTDSDAILLCRTAPLAVHSGPDGAVVLRQENDSCDHDDVVSFHRSQAPLVASAILREAFDLDAPGGDVPEDALATLQRCGAGSAGRLAPEDAERLAAYIARLERVLIDVTAKAGAVVTGAPHV